jgi:hypothetical protein
VSRLCICARRCRDSVTTELAGPVIEPFNPIREPWISHNLIAIPNKAPFGLVIPFWSYSTISVLSVNLLKLEAPDSKSVNSNFGPIPDDIEQSVIPETAGWRICGVATCTTENSYGNLLVARDCESKISTLKFLVSNLPPRRWIVTTMARIDDPISKVLVIHISARDNDAVCAADPGS